MSDEALALVLIQSYQNYVARAVSLFRHLGIKGNILGAWRRSSIPSETGERVDSDPAIPQCGVLDSAHSIRYSFHGIGCYVEFDSIVVDFDFGPNGRFDGFDAWRLHLFAESFSEFSAFTDVYFLQSCLDKLVETGVITKMNGVVGSHLYYVVEQR